MPPYCRAPDGKSTHHFWYIYSHHRFPGEENPVVMLGNSIRDGVLAPLIFRMKHHSLKVSTSWHESKAGHLHRDYRADPRDSCAGALVQARGTRPVITYALLLSRTAGLGFELCLRNAQQLVVDKPN
jgi:hypothetical protein